MKRCLAAFLCLAMLLPLVACKKQNTNTDALDTQGPAPSVTDSEKTTLLVYMIGSDLEAKGGAGTNDMEEILASQVDLTHNNVLVYAGGAKKWHNDSVATENGHTILQLTANGFTQLETREEVSMGDAGTLTYFLNFAYEKFTNNRFALILWDHGNGPLIGYGKDMLHDDDSITLLEMKQAMEASPFKGDNKLAWVGFDACLMSSVELACTWQAHAEYLIASQEIEPSFGWNYAFLSQLGKVDTVALTQAITDQYMESCLAYYEERGYEPRDTTLACLDLSKLDAVRTAVETLFQKAQEDVGSQYAALVASRVDTRALGRATTGSEYDLIDLFDLAKQMKTHYSAEAEALEAAVEAFVLHNATNAEGCCGVSIYYPFYNKSYYEKSWAEVYSQLNVLPAYTAYLDSYAKQWLKNDLVQTVASSVLPQMESASEFSLELTQEQTNNYADSRYFILRREGEQLYTPIFASSNITKKNNTLIANFDGDVIYAKNDFDEYWLPAIVEHDTVGDYTRYSTYVNLTNQLATFTHAPEDYEHKVAGHRFHISANNKTKEIKTSALVPYSVSVDTQALVGGKKEDAALDEWSQYYFLEENHLYLQKDENGTILPLREWEESSYLSANVSRVKDGIDFVFAPLPAGEYYLIFELEDTQGNRYCSDLLAIQSEGGTFPSTYEPESVEVEWKTGEKVQLFSEQGVTVSLTAITKYEATRYALEVENKNDFAIVVSGDDLVVNDVIHCPDSLFSSVVVPAGETVAESGIEFGDAEILQMINNPTSLQFSITVVPVKNDVTLVYHKQVTVKLSAETAALWKLPGEDSLFSDTYYYQSNKPVRGIQATEQVLLEQGGLRIDLLELGGNGEDDARMILKFCFANTGDTQQTFAISGLLMDDVYMNVDTGPITVYPGTRIYRCFVVSEDDLNLYELNNVSYAALYISRMEFATLLGGGGFSKAQAYPIVLATSGSGTQLSPGNTLLYEDAMVKLHLKKGQKREYGGYVWICTLTNKSNRDIMLATGDVTLNGKAVDMSSIGAPILPPYDIRCVAGKKTVFEVTYTDDITGKIKIVLTPQIYDFVGENLLHTGEKTYSLQN